MRKLSVIFTAIILLGFCANIYAQSDKDYKKAAKKQAKEWQKDGWKPGGNNTLPLEMLAEKYNKMLVSDNYQKLFVEIPMCNATCRAQALADAQNEYATGASSYIKSRTTEQMGNTSTADELQETLAFIQAYERLVSGEVKGAIELIFTLEKPNGSGKSYRAYFVVNEDKASQARLRAMQRAADETKLQQNIATQISAFVQEGFKLEREE